MTNIYLHEFVFTPMTKDTPTPIVEVRVVLQSEDKDESSLLASGFVRDFFDQDLNVTHKILIEGYKND